MNLVERVKSLRKIVESNSSIGVYVTEVQNCALRQLLEAVEEIIRPASDKTKEGEP